MVFTVLLTMVVTVMFAVMFKVALTVDCGDDATAMTATPTASTRPAMTFLFILGRAA